MTVDYVDKEYAAAKEKSARKRRLMLEKQFDNFESKAVIAPIPEGARPMFTKFKYDSTGKETKEKPPGEQQPEEEVSIFRKYWYLWLIGGYILMNMLTMDPQAVEQARAQAQGRSAGGGRS